MNTIYMTKKQKANKRDNDIYHKRREKLLKVARKEVKKEYLEESEEHFCSVLAKGFING